MNYQVYEPSAELQPFIKCFWTLEDDGNAGSSRQRVLPDGCMEMIFHYGDLYRQHFEDGSSIIQPRSFIYGQITKFLEIEPTGTTGLVSARFLPGGLAPFLAVPLAALEDKAVSLLELFGERGRSLEEKVIAATAASERIALIESFLLSIPVEPAAIDGIAKACVQVIFESQGQMAAAELADSLNISRRNMERRFTSAIGMSPKQLSKVIRLQTAIKMLGENKFTSLTALAYESGYYDQAHFIKDFKEFAGISPKSFFGGNLRFAALFAE